MQRLSEEETLRAIGMIDVLFFRLLTKGPFCRVLTKHILSFWRQNFLFHKSIVQIDPHLVTKYESESVPSF